MEEFRKKNPYLKTYGGQDLHRITNKSHVCLEVSSKFNTQASLLDALKKGNFSISNAFFKVDAFYRAGGLGFLKLVAARRILDLVKEIRDRLKGVRESPKTD